MQADRQGPDAGQSLGHYRIVKKLGSGGMGDVYLADDERLDRRVALKVLPPSMAEDAERRTRFEREAKAVATLNHPNIVTIHSVEEESGLHFFTMEFVQGTSLADRIPEGGFDSGDFYSLAIPLVDAVAAAHRSGVTHRDLKPANIMVSDEGRVKVLDFGLAKVSEGDPPDNVETAVGSAALTQVGRVLGTIAYMAPEQAEGKPVDKRSDVFALGIILYQMATGRSPFGGDTQISLMSSILKDEPISISDLKPALPHRLADIIHRCLEKDPQKRYQTAEELHEELMALKMSLDSGDLATSWGPLVALFRVGPGSKGRVSRAWRTAALAVLLLLMVAGALWYGFFGPGSMERSLASVDKRSLAVLYFQNMTGEESLDWLRTGLADMLITDLSQSQNLRVLSMDRLYQILDQLGQLEEQQVSFDVVQKVARRAGVGTVILGSFVRAGDILRINLRLQDASSGEVLSSERVEGTGESVVFELVDDLTRSIKKRFALVSLQEEQADRDLISVTTDSVEAYRNYVGAIQLHGKGDERRALPLLEKAVELDPEFAMALVKLSVAHGNLGNPDKAREFARRSLEHVDRLTDRERYYIEGRFYSLEPETVDRAVDSYQRAVELFPDHLAARNNLALLYLEKEDYEQAVVHLEELKKRGMTFPGSYSLLARAYASLGDFEKGREALEEFAREQPDNANGWMNLGEYCLSWGKSDAAEEAFRRARTLNPEEPQFGLWTLFVLKEQWEEAAREARLMEDLNDSRRWIGSLWEAVQHLYFGRLDEAEKQFEALIVLYPEGGDQGLQVREVAAVFLARMEKYQRALVLSEQIIRARDQGEDYETALLVASLSSAALGFKAQAKDYRDRLNLRFRPSEKRWQRLRLLSEGHLALLNQDFAGAAASFGEALPLFRKYDTQSPDQADAWFSLGLAQWKLGLKDEAAPWFQKVVEGGTVRVLAPLEFVRSLYFLGTYFDAKGEPEKARAFYERFLGYWGEGQIDRNWVDQVRSRLDQMRPRG